MNHTADIDLDFANTEDILKLIEYIPARMESKNKVVPHPSGVYVQLIPTDPVNGLASLPYKEADDRGYFKIDFLNMHVYSHIRDAAHYEELLNKEPPWERLTDIEFVKNIVHIGRYYGFIREMLPDNIPRMAMFLAALRPSKKHLLGKPWDIVSKTIWEKPTSGAYYFKKSHSISYSVLVGLHMNIIAEQLDNDSK